MTRIALRQYYREIEDLIHNDQAAEAEAHCQHIIVLYSKAITAHRLLGKSLVGTMNYSSAGEAFLRVLACIPDDIVVHIGMSVIREATADLDAAVWHMQQAVEIQPGNEELRSDLDRLLYRRDGIEPAKILLTRGALARMYLRGGLHDQALAELEAALTEEPERIDLQCLLVQVNRLAGKVEQAAHTAGVVLGKLPDCLEANLAMDLASRIASSSPEKNPYRLRLEALDPYYAHLSESYPSVKLVPDPLVTIEKLEWHAPEK